MGAYRGRRLVQAEEAAGKKETSEEDLPAKIAAARADQRKETLAQERKNDGDFGWPQTQQQQQRSGNLAVATRPGSAGNNGVSNGGYGRLSKNFNYVRDAYGDEEIAKDP